MKTISTFATACLLLLLLGALVGCDEDESVTEPDNTYVLYVGRIVAPSSIALGDTLWVTFTDIPMNDSCHRFHELEVEAASPEMNSYRLWGKVDTGGCLQWVWNLSHTIAITNFEGVSTHYIVIHQSDGTTLSHAVEIQ